MKDYKRIFQQLTHEEQQQLFDFIRKYKWIIQKLEDGESLNERELRFLESSPHYVNKRLGVDILEREIIFI